MKLKLSKEEIDQLIALHKKKKHTEYMRKWCKKVGREYLTKVETKSRNTAKGKATALKYKLSIKGICTKALKAAERRAKKHNRDFNITLEHLLLIYPANHVCPVRFVKMKPSINKLGAENAPTLDRIDNKKGYILDNVRFISRSANSKKGSK